MKARYLLPALLLLIYTGQCAWFIGTQSLTFDEPYHIVAGLDAWRHGRFERWNDHPPLARLLFTLPIARGEWNVELSDTSRATAITPDPLALTWRARAVNILLGLGLAILLWSVTRRLFSPGAANFALALFAFSPALIAHFSLATTDGAATLTTFLAAVQLARWRRNPSLIETTILGLVLGALLISKFSTLPMFALAVGLVLALAPDAIRWRPWHWNWGRASLVILLAGLTVWGGYLFHVTKVTARDGKVTVNFPNYEKPSVTEMRTPVDMTFYVPAAEYVGGLGHVLRHDRRGHPSFFLGEASPTGGWPHYFPVVVALKWPTIALLLFVAAVVLLVTRRLSLTRELRLLLLFPALFFLLAIFSKINIGDRHILPVYPFVLLLAAGTWHWAVRRRVARTALVALLLLHAGDSLRYAPDHLSYFNVMVKPTESWKLLADSSLDWGQGLLALRNYEALRPDEKIHLAYYGNVEPSVYGIRATPLGGRPMTGTVVVSAVYLAGRRVQDPTTYRWVLSYPRKALLNHTLHVFDVSGAPPPQ